MERTNEVKKWTKEEIREAWYNGLAVPSCTTGIGDQYATYEHAIQVLTFEIWLQWDETKKVFVQVGKGVKLSPEFKKHCDNVSIDLSNNHELFVKHGLTGAQFNQASKVAFQFIHYGYNYMIAQRPKDRRILVSKTGWQHENPDKALSVL